MTGETEGAAADAAKGGGAFVSASSRKAPASRILAGLDMVVVVVGMGDRDRPCASLIGFRGK